MRSNLYCKVIKMPYHQRLFAIVALLIVYRVSGQGKWRYSSAGRDSGFFSTNNPIDVQYAGSNEVKWCCGSGCTVNSTSPFKATIVFSKAGYHRFGTQRNGPESEDLRVIKVDHSLFCYEWYLVHNQMFNNTSREHIRVWVVDPLHASAAEANGSALEPSQYSSLLSGTFYRLGQTPVLTGTTGLRFVKQDHIVLEETFNASLGVWEFAVGSVDRLPFTVWIVSKPVALLNCFMRKGTFQLRSPTFRKLKDHNEQVLLRADRKYPEIIQDACAPHVAVYLSSSSVLLTQDNFVTSRKLRVNSSIQQEFGSTVRSAALTRPGLLLLFGFGELLLYDRVAGVFTSPQGVAHVPLTHLSTYKHCFEGRYDQTESQTVVAWTSQSPGTQLSLSSDGGLRFSQLDIPALNASGISNWTVEQVGVHSFFLSVTALFVSENIPGKGRQRRLLEYDLDKQWWTEVPFNLSNFIQDCRVSFRFLPVSSRTMLFWDCESIAYGGAEYQVGELLVRKGNSYFPLRTHNNGTIVSVAIGGVSSFAVLLSTNRMFYGRTGADYVLEVLPGESPETQMAAMFELTGQLLIVTNRSSVVEQRKFPLRSEVLNALYPDASCAFVKFATPDTPGLVVLDKGEELAVWATLIYPIQTHNDVLVQSSGGDLLHVRAESDREYSPGMVHLNKTFMFKHQRRNSTDPRPPESGAVSVYLHPEASGLPCEPPWDWLLHIRVGCPDNRHISIRGCAHQEAAGVRPPPCRLSAALRQPLQLGGLDMYDASRLLGELSSDYIVFETSGRADYGYTATMAQVGCAREAQTWKWMTSTANTTAEGPRAAWGQHNYESCFVRSDADPRAAFDASQPYEILNSSGMSQLVFHGAGRFQFVLKVVDPSLSFCDLEFSFSVDVGGEGEEALVLPQLISISLVLLGSATLLVLSYAHYRKTTLQRHRDDELVMQRMLELRSIVTHMKTAQETELVSRRPTGHSVRRITGTAQMLSGKQPSRGSSRESTITETPEPPESSSTSVRLRKSLLSTISQHELED